MNPWETISSDTKEDLLHTKHTYPIFIMHLHGSEWVLLLKLSICFILINVTWLLVVYYSLKMHFCKWLSRC